MLFRVRKWVLLRPHRGRDPEEARNREKTPMGEGRWWSSQRTKHVIIPNDLIEEWSLELKNTEINVNFVMYIYLVSETFLAFSRVFLHLR